MNQFFSCVVLFLDTVVGRHSCGDLGCILPNIVSFIYMYIYICPCFRSMFIVPGSQTKRLAHPEYPLHRHEHGIRVATCGHVEGISHHSFDIGFGVHQRMGYVPWRLKEPKSWKNEESMEPNDQPLFWGG